MKKWLILWIAFAMLLCGLTGCGKDKNNLPGENSAQTNVGNENLDPNSEEALLKPENKKYNRELRMMTEVESFYYHAYTYDIETEPTEICDVAIFHRQNYLREQFGIDLIRVDSTGSTAYGQFTNSMQVGSYICDIACFSGSRSITAAVNGWLLDLNQINELNLSASYWDQRIQEEYKIGSHLFTLEGEFNFIDDLRTYVVIYNDTMYNALDLESKYGTPYEMSAAGNWTYERMSEMTAICGHLDSNADNVLNEKDTWGFVSETIAPYYFFLGSGNRLINNEEGSLRLAFNSGSTTWESTYNIIENVMKLNESADTIVAGRPNAFSDTSDVWATASNIFMYNRALFRSTSLSAVLRLLDMEDSYGILPIPAYSKGQDGYYCFVNPVNHYPLSIPYTSKNDISEIAQMTETMAYYSYYGADSLNVAFYDLLAYARLCRKPEDVDMLKLVFASKTYDIDTALGITGAKDIVSNVSKDQSYDTLSSKFDQVKVSSDTQMKNLVNTLITNLAKQNG